MLLYWYSCLGRLLEMCLDSTVDCRLIGFSAKKVWNFLVRSYQMSSLQNKQFEDMSFELILILFFPLKQ